MGLNILLVIAFSSVFPTSGNEYGSPFRFEPFPPYTGTQKGFYPQSKGRE